MQNQYNLITNNDYTGRNQAILQAVAQKRAYTSGAWATFLQIKSKKLKLVNAKGQGVSIFKGFRTFDKLDKKTGKVKTFTGSCGFSCVFNIDLTEKIK